MLTCAPARAGHPIETQRALADYVVDLWDAGEDCRHRLWAVREIYAEPDL
ncbi:hypothetical protein [Amaricoccus sp.]|nr:hypothetical protein [Amaricoccus sp.]MBP7242447.1 hypothetical protein [Amaricoccus sp.]